MSARNLTIIEDDIWRQGMPLKDAVWAYATDDELKVLAEPQGPLVFHQIMSSISQTVLEIGKAIRPELQNDPTRVEFERYTKETKQSIARRKAATKEIQDWLIAGLQNGRFELFGYAMPRMPKDKPVKIRADLYDAPYINWEGSTVKGNGLEFVAVVLMEIETAPQIDIKSDHKLPPLIEHQARGPISAQMAIAKTIDYLKKEGLLPNNGMQKQLIPLIRHYAKQLYPGEFPHDRGLSNESIRTVLVRLIGKPTIQIDQRRSIN